ncbi:MAG: DUF1499 domain-containing protein [Nitrospirales bacterium]
MGTRKAIMMLAGLMVVGAVLVAGVLLVTWPLINVVETGKTAEYPGIQPRRYGESPDVVYDAARHAVQRLPRWTLASYDPKRRAIRAEASTRIFRFVDDVLIRVVTDEGRTVVHVRSASRVGRGDFGQNARNIRAFFGELDAQVRRAVRQHGAASPLS